MSARITMRDVARHVGVSPMTVSRALRDDETVNPKTRAKIKEVADALGYVYDTTAQAFRTNKSGFVAFTLPSLNNANFATTYRDLSNGLAGTPIQLLIGSTNYRVEKEEELIQQLLARNPEAMVLTGGYHTDTTRSLLKRRDIPVIEIWDLPDTPIGHVVGFSNADAMGLVVQHLAQTGRRRLAFVGAAEGADQRGAERRAGAEKAARDLGLPEMAFINCGPAPVSMRHGADAIVELGAGVAKYDALVCVSDPVAFGCLSSCKRLGLSVPDDLAITGFGNFDMSQVSDPRITTVNVNAGQIGHGCADVLRSIFEEGAALAPQVHDVGFNLVPGETS